MSKKENKIKKSGAGKFLLGAAIGAGLGILFAPKSGKETRKELKEKMTELVNKAKEIDIDEVKENITNKIDEIKAELADLDKEKVLKIAKEKANDIKDKCADLVEYDKQKGNPVLEKAADEVREKTIDVVKNVLERLEESDKKAKK